MKHLSLAAALMVLLALTPLSFAQENGGESGSGYGESSGEPNPSMEGGEGYGQQQQEGTEPEQQETSPDNPSDSSEMQQSPSDETNADQDNTNQNDADADNPDSAGSEDTGDNAQPSDSH